MAKGFIAYSLFFVLIFGIEEGFKAANQDLRAENKLQSLQVKDSLIYYEDNFLRYSNYIYKNTIKTVQLHRKDWELSAPIIKLNSDEQLSFAFDDLVSDALDYRYTLIHCDANWQESKIEPMDYLEGFTEGRITEFSFSFNSLQEYVHYELVFPEEDMKCTKSGNYIIKVYADDPDRPAISWRFMVMDPALSIQADIRKASRINDMNKRQELDFTIQSTGLRIEDPLRNLYTVLLQNWRWDNAIYNLKPRFIKGDEFDYNYEDVNSFRGGNEFRPLDIKSLKYQAVNIQSFKNDDKGLHVYLYPDKKKNINAYEFIHDINGKYIISYDEAIRDVKIESDYAWVHFTLPVPAPLVDGNLYVFGALTNWEYSREARMKYNYSLNAYETKLYLKQGYYNYQYSFLPNGENTGNTSLIEGSFYETENDYSILVYYRSPGLLYDQLIGVLLTNSLN